MKKYLILILGLWLCTLFPIQASDASVSVYLYTQEHQPIAQASFLLYKDQVVYEQDVRSDAQGKIVLDDLETGSYRLKQVSTQAGYEVVQESISFYYEEGQCIVLDDIVNTRMLGTLRILIVDALDAPMPAYTVTLISQDQSTQQFTTDASGVCMIENLVLGDYQIKVNDNLTPIYITSRNYTKEYELQLYGEEKQTSSMTKSEDHSSIFVIATWIVLAILGSGWYLNKKHFLQWLDEIPSESE